MVVYFCLVPLSNLDTFGLYEGSTLSSVSFADFTSCGHSLFFDFSRTGANLGSTHQPIKSFRCNGWNRRARHKALQRKRAKRAKTRWWNHGFQEGTTRLYTSEWYCCRHFCGLHKQRERVHQWSRSPDPWHLLTLFFVVLCITSPLSRLNTSQVTNVWSDVWKL